MISRLKTWLALACTVVLAQPARFYGARLDRNQTRRYAI
jgi:hypothetical protein